MLLQLSPITKRHLLTDSSWTDQPVYASRHPCLTYLVICYQILPGLAHLFKITKEQARRCFNTSYASVRIKYP